METVLGLTKFLHWIGNRLDRNRDQLVQLELMERKGGPKLSEYLAVRAATAPQTRAASAEHGETLTAPSDGTERPARSEGE